MDMPMYPVFAVGGADDGPSQPTEKDLTTIARNFKYIQVNIVVKETITIILVQFLMNPRATRDASNMKNIANNVQV